MRSTGETKRQTCETEEGNEKERQKKKKIQKGHENVSSNFESPRNRHFKFQNDELPCVWKSN